MWSQADIETEANKLLKQFEIDEPPVDVERIADSLGIEVNYESLDADVSGVMLLEKGKKSVAINSNHHSNRQRFTLAHEIAHLMLHTSSNEERIFIDKRFFRNDASSTGAVREEIDANTFAAYLLMPEIF